MSAESDRKLANILYYVIGKLEAKSDPEWEPNKIKRDLCKELLDDIHKQILKPK